MEESLKRSSSFTRIIMPETMTPKEVIDFINATRNGIIATVRKDGSPHAAWNPVAYVEDKLYTYADPHSVCYSNLRRDGRVSVAIASGDKAVFMEGEADEVGQVSKLIDTLLSKILSQVKDWIPMSSYNYASLGECQASIFEIRLAKILSYKS
ncbi:MAG: pyridoxamine 5'-phosphate oxidase family protein [Nitrososphaerales archaeon]